MQQHARPALTPSEQGQASKTEMGFCEISQHRSAASALHLAGLHPILGGEGRAADQAAGFGSCTRSLRGAKRQQQHGHSPGGGGHTQSLPQPRPGTRRHEPGSHSHSSFSQTPDRANCTERLNCLLNT